MANTSSTDFSTQNFRTSTLNLIDFRTNETLPASLPLLSLNPNGSGPRAWMTENRKHAQRDRRTAQRKDVTLAGSDNQRC